MYTDIRHTFSFRRQHAPANLNSNGRPQPQPSPHDIRARPVCQFFLKTAERRLLFLIPILHQTTTSENDMKTFKKLFLIPILHQTTTLRFTFGFSSRCSSFQFYIKPQRRHDEKPVTDCCSSFQFYIKPQHSKWHLSTTRSCSSFQFYIKPQPRLMNFGRSFGLFLIPILHQTTTFTPKRCNRSRLFLIPILHQTTTFTSQKRMILRCSSFQFYIKPQHGSVHNAVVAVVPHSNSTSNHNNPNLLYGNGSVVPHSNSTSNHNRTHFPEIRGEVVPHSNSTSNHNNRRAIILL